MDVPYLYLKIMAMILYQAANCLSWSTFMMFRFPVNTFVAASFFGSLSNNPNMFMKRLTPRDCNVLLRTNWLQAKRCSWGCEFWRNRHVFLCGQFTLTTWS